MSTVAVVPGATVVNVSMNATQAASLTSLLNNFFIPAGADTGLAELRSQLRGKTYPGSTLGRGGVTIAANRGRKPYKIAA